MRANYYFHVLSFLLQPTEIVTKRIYHFVLHYYNNLRLLQKIFMKACKHNNLEVAKWQSEVKPNINISTYNEMHFVQLVLLVI